MNDLRFTFLRLIMLLKRKYFLPFTLWKGLTRRTKVLQMPYAINVNQGFFEIVSDFEIGMLKILKNFVTLKF